MRNSSRSPARSLSKGETTMSNEFPPSGWLFRPESWPYWMSSTSLGPHSLTVPLDDPWNLAHSAPLSSAIQSDTDGGILASLTKRAEPISQDPSAWSLSATPFGASAGLLAPLAQPSNRFEESSPAWLQSVLPFDGNAASSVAAAQLTEQPTENSLFHQPTPVTQADWSTLPTPSAPAATFLPIPMLGTPDKDDPWLAASHLNLGLNLSPMQPIPDFLQGSRGVPLNPPTLLSEFPILQPPEHNAWRSHPLFEADRRPLGRLPGVTITVGARSIASDD